MVLEDRADFTLDGLVEAAYDTYLPAFEPTIPLLVAAWDGASADHPLKLELAAQIELLRGWDFRFSVESVPTSLAIFWTGALRGQGAGNAANATPDQLLGALAAASDELADDFGDWQTPWGEINRFQRLTGDIVQPFDDDAPSTPVAFPSANWGSLASFGARAYPGTNRWYGTSGNSFVAVVEFGDRVRARAVTAGGLNSVPSSPHFADQTDRYATGNLRDVYFYRADVEANAEREYHPGG
jgi:acyl-homoserine-lactone acylase